MKDNTASLDRRPDTTPLNKDDDDCSNRSWSSYALDAARALAHEASNFGEGLATGFALNSVNAIDQAIDRRGKYLPQFRFSDQEAMEKSTAGEAGSFIGSALNFALVNTGVKAAGLKRTLAMATTGALEGGLLTPTDPRASGTDFLTVRLENGATSFLTYAAFGAVASKTDSAIGQLAPESLQSNLYYDVSARALSNAAGGLIGGAASAELTSLTKKHEFVSTPELVKKAFGGAAFGATFSVASSILSISIGAVRDSQMVQPSTNLSKYIVSSDAGNSMSDLMYVAAPVSRGFVRAMGRSLNEMPKPVAKALRDNGTSIALVARVTDSFPELKGLRPTGWPAGDFDNCANLYYPDQNLVVFAERYVEPFGMHKLVRAPLNGGLQRHEVGHSADEVLEGSESPEFRAAYREDAAGIKTPEHKEIMYYYLQPENETAAMGETWADLFADLHGGPAVKEYSGYLRHYFAKSRQIVEQSISNLSNETDDGH